MIRTVKTGLLVATLLVATPTLAQEVAPLETPKQHASYGIGLNMAESLKQGGLTLDEVDPAALAQAISDTLNGVEPRVSDSDLQAGFEELGKKMEAKQAVLQAEAEAKANAALIEGQNFLEGNKSAEGITTTESGLQYKIVSAGEGDSPTAADQVKVHYEGRLLDGSVFDSSYDRGAPATFGVGQVIPGWTEALQLMKLGAKWEVWIPSEIAYGPRGAGADIGPNEVLNFTIELLEVVSQ